MADKLLDDLFHETLKDIYYAERQLLKALKKMARAAQSDRLKQAFEDHRAETETHVERLQKVFEIIGKPARGKTCQAIDGIIEEGDEVASEFKGTPALDAGLIAAAQAAEHYEIARYGTLRQWATQLGLDDAAALLEETLNEEAAADEVLTEIAESEGNQEAMNAKDG
ncbi:ferritin-like domain-containing protein [Paracoccus sp. S1E-3]|uniref:YciE/YciF ferroxidase family protein n=1 Tax=Paracoccus sp. S1E-3 TaxID=2756130 RepID=UPI0015EE3EC7|nr:ferritin-like domain-containing protein [Paracoccus sp. S1E-3]MBA4491679.1 ferritin-like domain-containing protein [Paracoccus sp. S1E-3]